MAKGRLAPRATPTDIEDARVGPRFPTKPTSDLVYTDPTPGNPFGELFDIPALDPLQNIPTPTWQDKLKALGSQQNIAATAGGAGLGGLIAALAGDEENKLRNLLIGSLLVGGLGLGGSLLYNRYAAPAAPSVGALPPSDNPITASPYAGAVDAELAPPAAGGFDNYPNPF